MMPCGICVSMQPWNMYVRCWTSNHTQGVKYAALCGRIYHMQLELIVLALQVRKPVSNHGYSTQLNSQKLNYCLCMLSKHKLSLWSNSPVQV